MSNTLERYYDGMGNVVIRDTNGNPSIFVRHPKQKSIEFDPSLPNHTHPAFLCGEGVEDDAVLFGKYTSSQIASGGAYYSLPNAVPAAKSDTYAQQMAHARGAEGVNIRPTEMTIADYGLWVLMAHQKGVAENPKGNQQYGRAYQPTGVIYTGLNAKAGEVRYYNGFNYRCLQNHTVTLDLLPPDAPSYWKKIGREGGVPVTEMIGKSDGSLWTSEKSYLARYTLTGSGPKSWYREEDPTLEADYAGNHFVRISDLRIVSGEIRIIPYNAAGDGSVDPTDDSLYRAILPHQNDNGFDFVAPGTAGTVHYASPSSGVIRLQAGAAADAVETDCPFNQIVIDTATLPYVPYILYELGLAPIPGTPLNHWFSVRITSYNRVPVFGSRFYITNASQTSGVSFYHNVSLDASLGVGSRLRAREAAAGN